MFKKFSLNWVLGGFVVLLVLVFVRSKVVEGLTNKDAKANTEVPELQSTPEVTPESAELKKLKSRVQALENAVTKIQSGK